MLGKIKMRKEQKWVRLDSKNRRDKFGDIERKRNKALDGDIKKESNEKIAGLDLVGRTRKTG